MEKDKAYYKEKAQQRVLQDIKRHPSWWVPCLDEGEPIIKSNPLNKKEDKDEK